MRDLTQLETMQTTLPSAIIDSWDQKFYTDLLVVDMTDLSTNESKDCPESHPEELIFSIWPGTVQSCDCIEDEKEQRAFLNDVCHIPGTDLNDWPEPT